MSRLEAKPENTAMVGDRLTTDIAGGINAGIETILVLSGVTAKEDLETSDIQPTYVLDDISVLAQKLAASRG